MVAILRENGPVVLVPSAWTVAGAAHVGAISERTLLIAHGVMAVLLAAFAFASWSEMREGVLRVWRGILVGGVFFTVAGVAGLVGSHSEDVLQGVSLYGWFLAPAVGLGYTAYESDAPHAYALGALLSFLGAVVYTVTLFPSASGATVADLEMVAIVLVGVGQTVGIGDAVYRY